MFFDNCDDMVQHGSMVGKQKRAQHTNTPTHDAAQKGSQARHGTGLQSTLSSGRPPCAMCHVSRECQESRESQVSRESWESQESRESWSLRILGSLGVSGANCSYQAVRPLKNRGLRQSSAHCPRRRSEPTVPSCVNLLVESLRWAEETSPRTCPRVR